MCLKILLITLHIFDTLFYHARRARLRARESPSLPSPHSVTPFTSFLRSFHLLPSPLSPFSLAFPLDSAVERSEQELYCCHLVYSFLIFNNRCFFQLLFNCFSLSPKLSWLSFSIPLCAHDVPIHNRYITDTYEYPVNMP